MTMKNKKFQAKTKHAFYRQKSTNLRHLTAAEITNLIHDLETHQVELQSQNEELQKAQLDLLDMRNRYADLYDYAPIGYLTLDANGIIKKANLKCLEMFGSKRGKIENIPLSNFLHEQSQDCFYFFLKKLEKSPDQQNCELQIRGPEIDGDKVYFWARVDCSPIICPSQNSEHLRLSIVDITEQKQAQELLHYQAHFDLLTDLPNRKMLIDRLVQSIARSKRSHAHGALLYIDIDNFKLINDTLGHATGDKILQHAAKIMKKNVRIEDTVSRFGGDEFVVLLTDLSTNRNEATSEARNIAVKI